MKFHISSRYCRFKHKCKWKIDKNFAKYNKKIRDDSIVEFGMRNKREDLKNIGIT